MSYYDNVNPDIFNLVPETAERILELGCGAGAMAAALRQRCPALSCYIGIEIDSTQAMLSRKHTTTTLVRNIDLLPIWDNDSEVLSAAPPNAFDYVLIGDVLEHLYDPLSTLKQASTRLKKGGKIIACIPNVQHWSVFYNLVSGTWPREPQGLFDATHIRWFTLDDMLRLFMQAELSVSQVFPREFPCDQGISVMEDLEPLARNLGVDPDVLIARGQVLKFVLVAGREHD